MLFTKKESPLGCLERGLGIGSMSSNGCLTNIGCGGLDEAGMLDPSHLFKQDSAAGGIMATPMPDPSTFSAAVIKVFFNKVMLFSEGKVSPSSSFCSLIWCDNVGLVD